MMRCRIVAGAIVLGFGLAAGLGARAAEEPGPQDRPPSVAAALPPALADPGGLRAALEAAGVTTSLTYIGEGLANTRGGTRRGETYQGRLDLQLDVDLERLAGLPGLAFHANLYQIHGRGLSGCCLANLLTASGIETLPATRLFELWLEQRFLDGKAAVRAGQLAADTEFLVSQYGGLFVNATFGWPTIAAANLPNGGPAYPTATPGIRVRLDPAEGITLLGALFNGDPVGAGGDKDPPLRDRSGFEFRTTDPALLIGEAAFAYGRGGAEGLPGTIKLGGWHHLGRFDDQRFGADGLSLADPLGGGLARRLRGNRGAYAVLDQMVYRVPGTPDSGVGLFARLSGSPSDRNLLSVYADGGVTFKGLVPGRPDDTFGLGVGYARVSGRARGLDRDAVRFGAAAVPDGDDPGAEALPGFTAAPRTFVRSSEALVEITYQAQIVPGFTIQPDFQYIIRPGAKVANPRDPTGEAVKNASVFGLRATVRY